MSNQAEHKKLRGSALVWILVWLLGVIGIAWTGLNYAVPRFEEKLQIAVQESISGFNTGPLIVSTKGRDVTLSGQVGSEEEEQLLMAAINSAPGVAQISSKLTIIEASTQSAAVAASANDETNLSRDLNLGQTTLVLAQAPAQPTEEAIFPLPEPAEEDLPPPEPVQIATIRANNPASSANKTPAINIKVFGNILSIEGTMSTTDDTAALVKNALDSFNLDVVSNGLQLDAAVSDAKWLASLEGLMPLMGSMKDVQISITNQQLTLAGLAPNRDVHDAVINKALASIGDFSLIEKITVSGETANPSDSTLVLASTTETEPLANAVTGTDAKARLAAEAASKAKAEEQARLAAEAAAKVKADAQAKQAAEAAALAIAQKEERLAAEAAAKVKAEEQARFAAEAAALAKSQKEERLAAEAAAKAEAEEQARLAAEATAKAEAEEQARLAAEATAKAEAEEQARLAAEAAAKAEAEEQARLAAEAAEKAEAEEQARLAAEAAEKAEAEEQARIAAEATAKAEAEEQARLAAEAAEKAEAEEQARIAAEATAKAEAAETAEAEAQARIAAEAAAKAEAEEQARLATAARADANEQAKQAALAAAKARAKERARLQAEAATQARAEELARLKAASDARAAAKLAQPPQAGDKVGLEQALQDLPSLRILFGTEGNRLTVESLDILDQIAETMIQYPDTQVIIEGHTDTTGDPEQNMQLSLLRATTVRDYLIRQGVSVYNLRAIGLGEAVPLVSNISSEGRAKNRRIEFTFR